MKNFILLSVFILFGCLGSNAQNFNFMKKITPPDIDSARVVSDLFGFSVAICGNYAVVGASGQDWDSAGGNYKSAAGAIYVFERRNGVWGYAKKLTLPNTDSARVAGDNVGRAGLAISGDYIAVGAASNNSISAQDWDSLGGNYKADAGAVYIFERNNGTWGFVKKLTPPNIDSARVAGDIFGGSLGISGNYLIVGAINNDYDSAGGNSLTNAGAAYIFERRNGVWGYAKKLSAPTNRTSADLFGYSVAMSGDYAVVGAPQQDYDSAGGNFHKTNAGAAYIYERNNGSWNFAKKITPPNTDSARVLGDFFGFKVAIDGTTAVVGAYLQDRDSVGGTNRTSAGAAYIFERNNGEWGYIKKITPNNSTGHRAASDQFGISVGISGNNIAIGANSNTYDSALANSLSSAGAVYVFEKRNGVWGYAKKLSAAGTNARNANDYLGFSVAINGNYVIAGAVNSSNVGHDWDSAGGNYKSSAGAAFIFENMLSLEYNNGWVGASPGSGTENYNCYITAGTASISSGAVINSLNVSNGATASLSGDLNIKNNYINNGIVSGGNVVLTGNSTHEILAQGATQNLTLNNTAGGADVRDSLGINGLLTLTQGTMITNSKLKLEATGATSYGQITNTGSGNIRGNVIAEMLITGGGANWRPVCSPFSDATLNEANDDVVLNFGTPDNHAATIRYFDEQAFPYWGVPSGTSTAFGDGAFSIYMGGSSSWANPLPVMLDISGTYRGTSDYTHDNLTRTGAIADTTGWHYIANPWPSGFTWDDNNITINSGGIQGNQIWLYDQSAGAYQVFDGTDNGVVPPFTPMLVEVTANNSSITLKNSARTTDSLLNYFDKTSLPNFVQVQVSDNKGKTDKVKFYTDDNATNGYDVMDGNKRPNLAAPNLYFVLEGKKANKEVWNTLPEENEPVQLSLEAKEAGQYTFSFTKENMAPNITVELEDKLTEMRYDITQGDYTFAHDLTNGNNRFALHFTKKSGVGVEEVTENKAPVYVGSSGNTITINAPNTASYTVEVIDLLGRTVQAPINFTGNQLQTVTVNGVSTGYYLVKINGNNVYKTVKVFLK